MSTNARRKHRRIERTQIGVCDICGQPVAGGSLIHHWPPLNGVAHGDDHAAELTEIATEGVIR